MAAAVSADIWAQTPDIMNAINLNKRRFRNDLCDIIRVQWFQIRRRIAQGCDGHDQVEFECRSSFPAINGSQFRASFLVNHFPVASMDIDLPSSPPAPPSSLPPSSAPNLSQSAKGRSPRRPVADVLAIGDDEPQEDDAGDAAGRRRRRAKGQPVGDVPLVKDPVGESVAESFETFLNTCVSRCYGHVHIVISIPALQKM
jgi:hypothetical protein